MSHLILLILTGWCQNDVMSIYIYLFGLTVTGIIHWAIYYFLIRPVSTEITNRNRMEWNLHKIWMYAILLHVIMNMLSIIIYFKIVHSFFINNNSHIQYDMRSQITVETSGIESINNIDNPFKDFMTILYWIYYAFLNNNFVSIIMVQLMLLYGLYEMETVNQDLDNCDEKYIKKQSVSFGFKKYYALLIILVIHRILIVFLTVCLNNTDYFGRMIDNVTNNLWNGYSGIHSELGSNHVFIQLSSKNHFFLSLIFYEHKSFTLSTVIMIIQYCLIRYYCKCKGENKWDNHFIFQQCIVMYFINWRDLPYVYLVIVALYFLIFFLVSYYRGFALNLISNMKKGYTKNNEEPIQPNKNMTVTVENIEINNKVSSNRITLENENVDLEGSNGIRFKNNALNRQVNNHQNYQQQQNYQHQQQNYQQNQHNNNSNDNKKYQSRTNSYWQD